MIRKFNEFLNEINSILTQKEFGEELEDQFLLLKEVYGCQISYYPCENISIYVHIDFTHLLPVTNDYLSKIVNKELTSIKSRLENMFPIKVSFQEYGYFILAIVIV